jgi:hypothetical protein
MKAAVATRRSGIAEPSWRQAVAPQRVTGSDGPARPVPDGGSANGHQPPEGDHVPLVTAAL